MAEQVKYTEQDLERALASIVCTCRVVHRENSTCARNRERIAELIATVRSEAQQANHLTAAVNARLAAAEKLDEAANLALAGLMQPEAVDFDVLEEKLRSSTAAWKEATGK